MRCPLRRAAASRALQTRTRGSFDSRSRCARPIGTQIGAGCKGLFRDTDSARRADPATARHTAQTRPATGKEARPGKRVYPITGGMGPNTPGFTLVGPFCGQANACPCRPRQVLPPFLGGTRPNSEIRGRLVIGVGIAILVISCSFRGSRWGAKEPGVGGCLGDGLTWRRSMLLK